MNNTNIRTSLDNTDELRNMILENPNLPLVIFAGEESYSGEYSYNLTEISSIKIETLAIDGEYYVEKEDFKEKLFDRYCDNYDTDDEIERYVNGIIDNTEFLKAIVIYVG